MRVTYLMIGGLGWLLAACGDIETLPTAPSALPLEAPAPLPTEAPSAPSATPVPVKRQGTGEEAAIEAFVQRALEDVVLNLATAPGGTVQGNHLVAVLRRTARAEDLPVTIELPCAQGSGTARLTIAGQIAARAVDTSIDAVFEACRINVTTKLPLQPACPLSAQLDGEVTCLVQGGGGTDQILLTVQCATTAACSGLTLTTAEVVHDYGLALTRMYLKHGDRLFPQTQIPADGTVCIDDQLLPIANIPDVTDVPADELACE